MMITPVRDGERLTLTVAGRLDTSTAPALDETIHSLGEDVKELVLDFEALEYISSAGLRVLLQAQKKMSARGGMVVEHVNEVVMEVFSITGFEDILTIR